MAAKQPEKKAAAPIEVDELPAKKKSPVALIAVVLVAVLAVVALLALRR